MAKENDAGTKAGACPTMSHAEIDQTLSETFPASDPPPWTLGGEPRCQPPTKQSEQAQKDQEQE